MFCKHVSNDKLELMLLQIQQQLEALKKVSVRTETRLCKLMEHQGANKALVETGSTDRPH